MTRLVITRPDPAAQRFLAEVEAALGHGVPALLAPLTGIEQIEVPSPARQPHALILTSENAVPAARRLGLATLSAFCVGDRTAEAARAAGLDALSAGGTVQDLIALVEKAAETGPLLYLRGEQVSTDLVSLLSARGVACDEAITYRQVALAPPAALLSALSRTEPLVVPLFSPAAARRFAALPLGQAPVAAAVMSPAVKNALGAAPFTEVRVAERPDAVNMVNATCALLRR